MVKRSTILVFLICGTVMDWSLLHVPECDASSPAIRPPSPPSDATAELVELDNFIGEVKRCSADFKWIRDKCRLADELRSKRRSRNERRPPQFGHSPSDGLSTSDGQYDEDDESADSWYSNFRRNECNSNGNRDQCVRFNPLETESVLSTSYLDDDSAPNGAVDSNRPSLFDDAASTDDAEPIDDQSNPAKNDLSHEANYKLSKFEQEPFDTNRTVGVRSKKNPAHVIQLLINERLSKLKNQKSHYKQNDSHMDTNCAASDSKHEGRSRRKRETDNTETAKASMDDGPVIILTKSEKDEPEPEPEHETEKNNDNYPDEEDPYDEFLQTEKSNNNEEKTAKIYVDIEKTIIHDEQAAEDAPAEPKSNIGITLELKVNNVTRQKIESSAELRRRKKAVPEMPIPLINTQNDIKQEKSSLEDIASGKFTNEVISAVYELIQSNNRLKDHIGPLIRLQHNPKFDTEREKELSNKPPSQSLANADGMLKNIMSSMNTIIRQQVDERTCVQLRPQLRRFVDNVIELKALQHKVAHKEQDTDNEFPNLENGIKYKRSIHVRKPDHPKPIGPMVCTSEEIREKFRTISELTRAFERLSAPNQLRAVEVNAYLKQHLGLLDDLQSFVRARRQTEENQGAKKTDPKRRHAGEPTSGRYAVLVRTAEFIRKNSLLGGKLGGVRDEDDYLAFENYDYDI